MPEEHIYIQRDEKLIVRPPAKRLVLDTVGAGDALSAVLILGLLKKWDFAPTLRRGVKFAAAICRIKGAVPDHAEFYTPFLDEWNLI